MKKYIRTKDGIYEVNTQRSLAMFENDTYVENGVAYTLVPSIEDDENLPNLYEIKLGEVIAEADTIEELCDGFYLDDGQEEFCLDDVFTNFDKFKSSYIYNNENHIVKYDGYGFIKTSKGLIYVSKMNDEGKLCLI